jgi:EmrB/QacA subfamily drug resistance transporter
LPCHAPSAFCYRHSMDDSPYNDNTIDMDTKALKALRKSALIIAVLDSFIMPFMGSAVSIALPAIEKDLNVDAVLLTWIPTAYLLALAIFMVPFGRLADIYGRKRIFIIGILLFSVSTILCALSTSITMLLFFRVLQGIGNAIAYAPAMAILVSVYPLKDRGKVLGINVSSVYIGLSAGPFLGGLLTHYLTWRSVFLSAIPFCIVILFLIFRWLKSEWADAKEERFDLTGSIIYGIAIAALILGMSSITVAKGWLLILAGLASIFAFIKWELKEKQPVFDVTLFKTNRVFAFSNLAALINYAATYAISFLMSLYLQDIKGLSAQLAGIILVSQPIMMAGFSPLAGKLSDRIEPRIVATLGMIFTTIGLSLFAFLTQQTSLAYIIFCLIILGFGFALFSSPNTNAIMSSVEKRNLGIASGMTGTMRSLGMMVSMGVSTLLFSILIGRVQLTPAQYPMLMKSIVIAFIIFTAFCFIGIFASMARGKRETG